MRGLVGVGLGLLLEPSPKYASLLEILPIIKHLHVEPIYSLFSCFTEDG